MFLEINLFIPNLRGVSGVFRNPSVNWKFILEKMDTSSLNLVIKMNVIEYSMRVYGYLMQTHYIKAMDIKYRP